MINKKLTIKILLVIVLQLSFGFGFSQSIVGKWKTIDDDTGKERSIVEIYQKDDKIFGKVIKLFMEPGEPPNPICDECEDERKDQPVLGMEIIKGLAYEPKDEVYEDGEILDPENGNIYDCKLWLEEGKLKVRGYLYFIYRTQTWLPVEE